MKIVVADKYPDRGLAELRALGCELVYEPEAKDEKLVKVLSETKADVLVVRSSKVNRACLETGTLSLVVRAGAGFDTIDVKAASALGIYVSNCPGKNSAAVAELAFGLLLSIDRRIPDNVAQLREGKWNKKEFSKAPGLLGRTLGLIGLGRIGEEMIPRAKGFGMEVVAWSRSLTPDRAAQLGVAYRSTPEQVAASCDVLSVHVALNADTKGRIGHTVFQAMKPGSYFINTSRAEVVDQPALEQAIAEKGVRAGLDVFAKEPSGASGTIEDAIAKNPAVYGTHHIGASTDQAQDAIATETARIIRTFKDTGRVVNVVNLARQTPARYSLVVRHRDRVGVLAHVLDAIKKDGINVQEMENVVFDGAEAAIARIHLDRALQQASLSALKAGNADILDVTLVSLAG